MSLPTNVTRLGDLLDFEQFFKAFGRNYFAQISHILRQFLLIFLVKSFLGNFYRLLAIFFWSHCSAYLFQFAWLKDKLGPKNKYDIAETLVIKSSSLETIDQPSNQLRLNQFMCTFRLIFDSQILWRETFLRCWESSQGDSYERCLWRSA